jgi:hypothetical protein
MVLKGTYKKKSVSIRRKRVKRWYVKEENKVVLKYVVDRPAVDRCLLNRLDNIDSSIIGRSTIWGDSRVEREVKVIERTLNSFKCGVGMQNQDCKGFNKISAMKFGQIGGIGCRFVCRLDWPEM